MNIFILDLDKELAARYHVDKHIVKMPLETAQLLCGVHHVAGSKEISIPYRLSFKDHPCAKWARESISNYVWLCEFGIELCKEYTYRYGKIHGCEHIIRWCLDHHPTLIKTELTPFVQVMPDKYKSSSVVDAYRQYYIYTKRKLFNWKNRPYPYWVSGENNE